MTPLVPGASRRLESRSGIWALLLAVAAAIPPLLHPWLCDDIFITFRYVERALTGAGLTYNPGEHVEGYTHFLWAILLWALHALGIDLETLGRYLPLVFYVASVFVLARTSAALFAQRRARLYGIPVAALLWAVHREAHVFASGGLETMAFVFFLVLGFDLVAVQGANSPRALRLGAVAYSLAALTRPEGLLHLAVAFGAVLLWKRDRREVRDFLLLSIALVVPLYVWRAFYYHDFVPNSFHAKSAGHAYWSQGVFYVALYFRYYAVLLVGVVGAVLALRGVRSPDTNLQPEERLRDQALGLALAHVAAVILTTAYVGGDFMFGRFLLPATPFLALLCENAVVALPRPAATLAAAALAGAVFAGGLWREKTLHGINVAVRGIADERSQYPADLLARRRAQSEILARCFKGTNAVFLVQGSQASYAYYGRFPVAIEAYGLTDRTIARAPLAARGRPGHERGPALEYLLRRGTNFVIHLPGARVQRDFARIDFGDLLGEIVVYDRDLMEHARDCEGVRFTDFPTWFDAWAEHAVYLEPAARERDAAAFRAYYFSHNSDPERAARLAAIVEGDFNR